MTSNGWCSGGSGPERSGKGHDFEKSVFPKEIQELLDRGRPGGFDPSTDQKAPPLTGLALSGGGIRSASFCLGVMQALDHIGLFKALDYLSTVSGGGYIGSSLTTHFIAGRTDEFPYKHEGWGHEEPAAFRHLRDKAAYLTPKNLLEAVRMPALVLWGVLANFITVLPILLVAAWVTAYLSGGFLWPALHAYQTEVTISLPKSCESAAEARGCPEGAGFREMSLPLDIYALGVSREGGGKIPNLVVRGLPRGMALVRGGACLKLRGTDGWGDVFETPILKDLPADGSIRLRFPVTMTGSVTLAEVAWKDGGAGVENWSPANCADDDATRGDDKGPTDPVSHLKWLSAVLASVALAPFGLTFLGYLFAIRFGQKASNSYYWRGLASLVVIAAVVAIAMAIAMVMTLVLTGSTWITWWRFLIYLGLVAIPGLLLYFALMFTCRRTFEEARANGGLEGRDGVSRNVLACGLLWTLVLLVLFLQPLAVYYFDLAAESFATSAAFGDAGKMSALGGGIGALLASPFLGGLMERKPALKAKIALVVVGILGPLFLWLAYLNLVRWALTPEAVPALLKAIVRGIEHFFLPVARFIDPRYEPATELLLDPNWFKAVGQAALWSSVYLLLAWLIYAILSRFLDPNRTSLHGFYRDQLSKAFLFTSNGERIEQVDGPKLSRAKCPPDGSTAPDWGKAHGPIHLVNTALNIRASDTANARGRNAVPFVFSPLHVGSKVTGYWPVEDIERLDPHIDLGTAMAVSGAAFSPNMGNQTKPLLTFLLSLLNVRLGYWLPIPGRVDPPPKGAWFIRFFRSYQRPGPSLFLKEALGKLDEKGKYLYLSDGGHIENLGVYELLRRRCRYIIAVDGEQDGGYTFEGLANLVRMARIDFGIKIDIDVDCIRPGPVETEGERPCWDKDGMSRSHFAVGEIDYGSGPKGKLIYIKSSVTGDEDVDVQEYRCKNPDFPHQTTLDQFFDETQFEAYRSLGYHAAQSLLDAFGRPGSIEQLFDGI